MTLKKSKRISFLERAFIARNISLMLHSGIPVAEAFSFLENQIKNAETRKIIAQIQSDAQSGMQLSRALEKVESSFGRLFVHFVKIGEQSGTLETTLAYLADQLERDNDLSKRTRSAAVYPSLILGIVAVYAAVFSYYIFPRLQGLYTDFAAPVPALTRWILSSAEWIKNWGVLVLGILIVLIILFRIGLKSSRSVARLTERFVRILPGISGLVESYTFARIFRIMGSLLKSGAPLVEVISSTREAIDNVQAQEALSYIEERISQGKTLSSSMEATKFFPALVIQLVEVAERSGSLEKTLFYLSTFYDQNVDYRTKNLTSIAEPLLLIFVGIAVALLAIAIILPIYQFSASIRPF